MQGVGQGGQQTVNQLGLALCLSSYVQSEIMMWRTNGMIMIVQNRQQISRSYNKASENA